MTSCGDDAVEVSQRAQYGYWTRVSACGSLL